MSFKKFAKEELLSKKIGMLSIFDVYDEVVGNSHVMKCRCICDCGKTVTKTAYYFRRAQQTYSCGCTRKRSVNDIFNYQVSGEVSLEGIILSDVPTDFYIRSVRYRATQRNITYDVSDEYLGDLYKKQNGKCMISGLDIVFYSGGLKGGTRITRPRAKAATTASLDRINSNIGYIKGNVRWVHKDYNMLRCDLSDEKFFNMCMTVAQFQLDLRKNLPC